VYPSVVAWYQLGEDFPAARKLLEAPSFMQSVWYQRKVGDELFLELVILRIFRILQ
jgi:hypothetical protein